MKEITLNVDEAASFSCSHFLYGFDKCNRLHGHNYCLRIKVKGVLGNNEALVDFRKLKEKLNSAVTQVDHRIIIPSESGSINVVDIPGKPNIEITAGSKSYSLPREDVVLLPVKATTCEHLSIYFHERIKEGFPELKIQVTVEETPGNAATYSDTDF